MTGNTFDKSRTSPGSRATCIVALFVVGVAAVGLAVGAMGQGGEEIDAAARVRIVEGRSGELYLRGPNGEQSLVVRPGAVVEATIQAFNSPRKQAKPHARGHEVIEDFYSEVCVSITKVIRGEAPQTLRLYSPIVVRVRNGQVEMTGFLASSLRALVPGMRVVLAIRPPTARESSVIGDELWRILGEPWILVDDESEGSAASVTAQYELTEQGMAAILDASSIPKAARKGVHFTPTGEPMSKPLILEQLVRRYEELEETFARYLELKGHESNE